MSTDGLLDHPSVDRNWASVFHELLLASNQCLACQLPGVRYMLSLTLNVPTPRSIYVYTCCAVHLKKNRSQTSSLYRMGWSHKSLSSNDATLTSVDRKYIRLQLLIVRQYNAQTRQHILETVKKYLRIKRSHGKDMLDIRTVDARHDCSSASHAILREKVIADYSHESTYNYLLVQKK